MEKLNNIRNYDEFKEALNEELLWDVIKNLFSKLFAKIDKKLSDSIANFTKKLDGAKNYQESLKFYEEVMNQEKATIQQSLATAGGPLSVRKILADNCTVVYVQLQELSNKYQTPTLAAKTIFAGKQGNMFNFDKSEDFNNNLMQFMNAKVIELGKNSGYDEKKLQEYLGANATDMNKVQPNMTPEQSAQKPAVQNPTQKSAATGNQQQLITKSADIPYNQSDMIFEQDQQTATNTAGNTIPQGNPVQLKTNAQTWLTNEIYGYSLETVKKVPQPANAGAGGADAFDTIAKGSKATTLYPNLAKLLRNIVNIQDKNVLIKVRDAIATAQNKKPEDFKNEMPL